MIEFVSLEMLLLAYIGYYNNVFHMHSDHRFVRSTNVLEMCVTQLNVLVSTLRSVCWTSLNICQPRLNLSSNPDSCLSAKAKDPLSRMATNFEHTQACRTCVVSAIIKFA